MTRRAERALPERLRVAKSQPRRAVLYYRHRAAILLALHFLCMHDSGHTSGQTQDLEDLEDAGYH